MIKLVPYLTALTLISGTANAEDAEETLVDAKVCADDRYKGNGCLKDLKKFIRNYDCGREIVDNQLTRGECMYGEGDGSVTEEEYAMPFIDFMIGKSKTCDKDEPFCLGSVLHGLTLKSLVRDDFTPFDINRDRRINGRDDFNSDNRITNDDRIIYQKRKVKRGKTGK